MIIYEGYFNDKESSQDDIVTDIEQTSANNSSNSLPISSFDYVIVIELSYVSSSKVENEPSTISKTISYIKYILENHRFITDYSDKILLITNSKELETTDIIYDSYYGETAYGIMFGINVNASNPINIIKFFAKLYNFINKNFFNLSGIGFYQKDSVYMHYIDNFTMIDSYNALTKQLQLEKANINTIKEIYNIITVFRTDLDAYKKFVSFFNITPAYKKYLYKQVEHTLKSNADWISTNFNKVKFPKSFINKLNNCSIDTDVLKDREKDFHLYLDSPKRTSLSYLTDPNFHYATYSGIRNNQMKITDIVIKQYDNMRRLMIYIYLGPFFSINNKEVFEAAIYLGEDKEDGYSDEIAQDLSDLTYNQISVEEIKKMFDKYMKPSEAL